MKLQLNSKVVFAEIDTFGAQLTSLQDMTGREYLWQGDPTYWSGQAPVLFPIVGSLRDGKAKIGNQEISMASHGFARKKEFKVIMSTSDSVTLSLKPDEETLAQYPFEFSLLINYRVNEYTLTTEFMVMNMGKTPMPYTLGGHPAFNTPILPGENFESYYIQFEKEENQTCPQILSGSKLIDHQSVLFELNNSSVIPLTHELFERDALIFENLSSEKVSLISRVSGRGIEMDFKGFPYLGIWSAVNHAPFVALEPWTGCATGAEESDSFEKKRGMQILDENGSVKYSFKITLL